MKVKDKILKSITKKNSMALAMYNSDREIDKNINCVRIINHITVSKYNKSPKVYNEAINQKIKDFAAYIKQNKLSGSGNIFNIENEELLNDFKKNCNIISVDDEIIVVNLIERFKPVKIKAEYSKKLSEKILKEAEELSKDQDLYEHLKKEQSTFDEMMNSTKISQPIIQDVILELISVI